jgi:hypothetical protein
LKKALNLSLPSDNNITENIAEANHIITMPDNFVIDDDPIVAAYDLAEIIMEEL